MAKKKGVAPFVLEYYPNAKPINVKGVKTKSDYYEIWSDGTYLGKGKSRQCAWRAAYRNMNS